MPESYELHEAALIQARTNTSAANALVISAPAVPSGKVWTILEAFGTSSVAGGETQYVWFAITATGGLSYPVTRPVQQLVNITTSMYFPLITEGLELKLFPGDQLSFYRAAATVGSTLLIYLRYIETDLPLYVYVEPQERKRQYMARTSIARALGSAASGGSSPIVDRGGGRGPREPGSIPI